MSVCCTANETLPFCGVGNSLKALERVQTQPEGNVPDVGRKERDTLSCP